jgi:16S rRNA C1402 N4-methylase RsmH
LSAANKAFETTLEFVEVIRDAVPGATAMAASTLLPRAFRRSVAVNDELGVIEEGLKAAWELLARVAALSSSPFIASKTGWLRKDLSNLPKTTANCSSKNH